MSTLAQHAAGSRRMRTTDVSVVIINADEKLTTRASVAIIMSAIESVSGVQITANGMLTLDVKRSTLLLGLQKALRDALALLDVDFIIQAPEDDWQEAPVVLTTNGWRYQLNCSDCGTYEDDINRPIVDHVCDDCIEKFEREEAAEDEG